MSSVDSCITDFLKDVYRFLYFTLQKEALTSLANSQKESLLSQLHAIQVDYPCLQIQLCSKSEDETEPKDERRLAESCTSSSPVPYIDMNGESFGILPTNALNPENFDCEKDKDISENHSLTESEDYASDEAKGVPEVAASDLCACEKSGYLDKKKKRDAIKGWLNPFQKRWCAIKDGILYYFEKTSDRKQKGCIVLEGYEARPVIEDNKDGKKYSHCFELVCPGKRTYQFSATSEKDVLQWIQAVQHNNKVSDSGKICTINAPLETKQKHSKTDAVYTAEDIYETVDENSEEKSEDHVTQVPEEDEDYSDADILHSSNIFNYNEWYVGLWDCFGADESELSFYRGDLIHIISKEYDSYAWWVGELQGKTGFVPKSYLMEAYEAC
ncbi:src kinase-associated phosphoprotein 2-B-like [Uloborus diversus]|uniref:src kinase-associated phosphoprotein 2-B-like n=1 Tax=Uloborus diversus TaxID=327109 RepID=UPI00240A4210|nr:src kinase-associated phosphoprotein 2-B-like [Uloborus diversus]